MTQPSSVWVTPEPIGGPAPGIEFASHGARLVAYIVDIVIQGMLAIGVFIVTGIAGFTFPPVLLIGLIAGLAITVGYFPWFWARGGQTPGMKMMQIKVVRDADGGPVTAGQAILRLVGYWISGLVFYIGYIWIFVDRRRRGWHDLLGGTVVISAPSS